MAPEWFKMGQNFLGLWGKFVEIVVKNFWHGGGAERL